MQVRVTNFERQMNVAVKKLDQIGRKDLNKAIRKAVIIATKPTRRKIRNSIRADLPKKGGLNLWVGKMPSARSRFSSGVSVASIKLVLDKPGHNFRKMNATGEARHPTFGNRKKWSVTKVPARFFERPLIEDGPRLKGEVTKIVSDAIAKTWSKK